MTKRSAFTLVELCITMSAGTALLILAIGILHQSLSLASVGRDRSNHQQTLQRLAREFRRDVHRAEACTVTSSDRARLVMPDGTSVTYDARADHVSRQQRLDEQLVRLEVFRFSVDSMATFQSLDTPSRAVLTVAAASPVSEQPRVDRSISAVVGRLLHHQHAEVSR